MHLSLNASHEKERVLTKAVLNLARFYQFSGKDLSAMIGLSESSVSRLHQGKKCIDPESKEGEMALLLVRIYRSLNALLGHHHDKAQLWLNSHNHYLQQKPIEMLKTIPGLVAVLNYLDAMRGKL
ncbi:MAG: MbcA/ParS/Xre antitoxin family protein [Gammaproteobacteria bacterium]|nr:MbcA/ParS/Xre antitoxin family protein [Gammaproteobacteria bacterium]